MREKEILEILRHNPFISQQEIADKLNIQRSSVAVHIMSLMKKGYIKGKGYVLNDHNKITVIGGANIDLQAFPYEKLTLYDSNPGALKTSVGGVGRNIAENITKLGLATNLITCIGDDIYGKRILQESTSQGINIDHVQICPNQDTSTYLSIMDENNDVKVAISAMDIMKELNPGFIQQKHTIIKQSEMIIVDCNLEEETLEYIFNNFNDIPIFVDTVSTTKAMKIKNNLQYIHAFKPNIYEAELLYGEPLDSKEAIQKAGEYFISRGVKEIFISLGKDGVYAKTKDEEYFAKAKPKDIQSTNGAGDALLAALVVGYSEGWSLKKRLEYAICSSLIALSHESTINPNMSMELLQETVGNNKILFY